MTSHGCHLEKGRRSKQRSLSTVQLKMPAGHSCSIVCSSSFPKWWTACVKTVRHRSEPMKNYRKYCIKCERYAFNLRENSWKLQLKQLSLTISPNILCMAIISNFLLASIIICAKAEISNGDVAFPFFCLRCCRK